MHLEAARRFSALEARRSSVVRQPVPGSDVRNAAGQRVGLARRAITLRRLPSAAARSLALPASGLAISRTKRLAEILRGLAALRTKLSVAVALLAIALAATASATSTATFRRALTLPYLVDADAKVVYPSLHPFRRQLLKATPGQRTR